MNPFKKMPELIVYLLRTLLLAYLVVGAFGWFFADHIIFLPPASGYTSSDDITFIKNGDGQLAAYYLKNENAEHTILYSHGNAVDIGYLRYLFDAFYQQGYSVLAYDYSGYGQSTGKASELQSYKDIESAYDYLLLNQGIEPENIIVYGHSVGAAVALDLASKKQVGALVLEAPFVTAFRVLTKVTLYPFDKFSNIEKLPAVKAPVYIMHSRDDSIIPFWHSQKLIEIANSPVSSYWLDKAGHDGISASGTDYWLKLKNFLNTLDVP